MEILHGAGDDQRLLGVVEDMCKRIHSDLVVTCVHSHGLLAHCTLIGISWRLVVIGEWDDGGADSKDH